MLEKIQNLVQILKEIRNLPKVDISLKFENVKNTDPFYEKITKDFYDYATARHRKFLLIKNFEIGVALFDLSNPKGYRQSIESSARRNCKKAIRNGFTFDKLAYNLHLDEIWEIRRSTPVRQGEMPEDFLNTRPTPVTNPSPQTNTHDYVYFGVFDERKKLVAYAGCMVAGEILMVQHIYGHNDYLSFGVVPYLLVSIAETCQDHYPEVRYFNYGTFYGAQATMKRFKKKFQFLPHRVNLTL
ncbi:hypothetical protein [Alteromonas flava]|uniref:hypothetical protein n=1 Tax=Alteromonas flava TaxID=2048003 RepID=UPI000C2905FA|nr:hypothetical protein [Alteromonas flava]